MNTQVGMFSLTVIERHTHLLKLLTVLKSTDTRPILDLDPTNGCLVFTCTDQKKNERNLLSIISTLPS